MNSDQAAKRLSDDCLRALQRNLNAAPIDIAISSGRDGEGAWTWLGVGTDLFSMYVGASNLAVQGLPVSFLESHSETAS
jgi:hypothetical protein